MVIRSCICGCLSDQQAEDQLEPACSWTTVTVSPPLVLWAFAEDISERTVAAGNAAIQAGSEGAVPAPPGLAVKAQLLLNALRPAYWQALAVVALLYFSRFDAGFATLRAKTVGCHPAGGGGSSGVKG